MLALDVVVLACDWDPLLNVLPDDDVGRDEVEPVARDDATLALH
jgi:hypothetical protein